MFNIKKKAASHCRRGDLIRECYYNYILCTSLFFSSRRYRAKNKVKNQESTTKYEKMKIEQDMYIQ